MLQSALDIAESRVSSLPRSFESCLELFDSETLAFKLRLCHLIKTGATILETETSHSSLDLAPNNSRLFFIPLVDYCDNVLIRVLHRSVDHVFDFFNDMERPQLELLF